MGSVIVSSESLILSFFARSLEGYGFLPMWRRDMFQSENAFQAFLLTLSEL